MLGSLYCAKHEHDETKGPCFGCLADRYPGKGFEELSKKERLKKDGERRQLEGESLKAEKPTTPRTTAEMIEKLNMLDECFVSEGRPFGDIADRLESMQACLEQAIALADQCERLADFSAPSHDERILLRQVKVGEAVWEFRRLSRLIK